MSVIPHQKKVNKVLQRGAVGKDVLTLQEQLQSILHVELLKDGLFGPQTQAAVKAFQQLSGLAVTGIIDETTSKKLSEAMALQYQGSPAANHTAGSAPGAGSPAASPNDGSRHP